MSNSGEAIFNLQLGYVVISIRICRLQTTELTLANLGKKKCIGKVLLDNWAFCLMF